MLGSIKRHQDRYAGGLIGLVGLLVAGVAATYSVGTLRAMGPGFFPLILGVIMTGLGVLIAFSARGSEPDPHGPEGLDHPEVRGWLCILGGVIAFIVLAERAGLAPATFGCVFIAAMGDRAATVRTSFVLALAVSAAGVLLFHYGLRVQLAPFAWKWG